MSDKIRCTCRHCSIRNLMGPAVITTVGILFLLGETVHGYFSFWRTFPVILIVIGVILLASSLSPTDGHVSSTYLPPQPPAGAPPTQGPLSGQGQ